jgi:hypothetical protein
MTLWQNLALFLPLALGICMVASALGEDSVQDILKKGLRFFIKLLIGVVVISAILTILMEFVLAS